MYLWIERSFFSTWAHKTIFIQKTNLFVITLKKTKLKLQKIFVNNSNCNCTVSETHIITH